VLPFANPAFNGFCLELNWTSGKLPVVIGGYGS
jgi:hypothetical protein